MEAAMEILRKKGQLVAAKRSDREASEGCVLAKVDGKFGAMIALKCETDFVAKNADFVALANKIIDAAIAARCKTLEEVKNLNIDGVSAAEAVVNRSGITGEKMELDGYATVEGEKVVAYNHMNQSFLCTLVAFNKETSDEVAKGVAMQAAAMAPIYLNEAGVSEETKAKELASIVDKTKEDEVKKAVENALKKAGINPNLVDSEDHIESNMSKGWLTQEQADEARKVIADAKVEGEAQLKPVMIENIAKGRVQKFLKENCLVDQEFQFGDGDKATVSQWLSQQDKELKIVDFRRFTLAAE
jgi:elongation factor Ts